MIFNIIMGRNTRYVKLSLQNCPWCNSTALCIDSESTAFFKQVFNSVLSHVLNIINKSLRTLIFPGAFRTADVKPLLKKPNLDSNTLTNYRLISSLLFISKILEKIVSVQVNCFLKDNNLLEEFRSGFRRYHNTETAVTKMISDLRQNSHESWLWVLFPFDPNTASDTSDHDILINHLERLVGLYERVVNWFRIPIKQ